MDFSLSTEHELSRDLIRRFCKTEIAPLVQQAEETETFPVEIYRKWRDLGVIGIRYPAADGGSGMAKVADCIVREEISAVSQSFATAWSAHSDQYATLHTFPSTSIEGGAHFNTAVFVFRMRL
jgi:butyryl-CoA dehydrogenase